MIGSGFILGAGATALLYVTRSFVQTIQEEKKCEEKGQGSSQLKILWHFFDKIEKGKVVTKRNGGLPEASLSDRNISFFVYIDSDTLRNIHIFLDGEQVFNVHYDLETKEFKKFTNPLGLLRECEFDLFIEKFQRFIKTYEGQRHPIEITHALNEHIRKEEKDEIPVVKDFWESTHRLITDDELQPLLRSIQNLCQEIQNMQSRLNQEDHHRFLRIQETLLPELTRGFVHFTVEERQDQKDNLVSSLEDVQDILREILGTATKEQRVSFEKNRGLIKQMNT